MIHHIRSAATLRAVGRTCIARQFPIKPRIIETRPLSEYLIGDIFKWPVVFRIPKTGYRTGQLIRQRPLGGKLVLHFVKLDEAIFHAEMGNGVARLGKLLPQLIALMQRAYRVRVGLRLVADGIVSLADGGGKLG